MCDQLVENCDLIQEFCLHNESDPNKKLISDCEQLVSLAKAVAEVAGDYKFETISTNGFTSYVRMATAYTGQIVSQINEKNKIEADFLKLFRVFPIYGDYLIRMDEKLKEERGLFDAADKSCQHLMVKERGMSRREIYDGVQ